MAKKKYNTILSPDTTFSKETQLAQQMYAQKPHTTPVTKANQQAILEAKKTIKPTGTEIKPVLPITSPSLGRLGIKPSTTQIEAQKAQALKDIKSSAFTRANVGAMQGLSPIGFKLGKEEQAILDKSKAYKGGEIAGTMASFALPYAGLGKGVLQGTTKLAPKLIPSTSGLISKGITKVAPKVASETAERVGKNITESLIKDIAIGTPMNIAYAYGKENLQGTEALKNIAFNTGLDLITGGILEAAPLILKSGKKVASKVEFEALPKEEQDEVIQLLLPAPKEVEAKMIPENKVIAGGKILDREFKPMSKDEYLLNISEKINKLEKAQNKLKTKIITKEEFNDIGKLALSEYDRTVKSVADYINNYKPKGTQTYITPKNSDELMRDGGIRTTISNNDIWYQDFYKKNGRKPNRSESKELAELLVKQDLRNKNGEFYNEELANMLDEIKTIKVGTPSNSIKNKLEQSLDELTKIVTMEEPEFSEYAKTMNLGKTVTGKELVKPLLEPLQFKTQITADELLKAQNKAIEPQTLGKGTNIQEPQISGLKRDLGADINRIQPTTQANLERYGTMKQGEQLADELGQAVTREIEVPKGTAYGDTMQFARTVAESKNVTDEFADDILNAINEGDFAKATKSNVVAVDNANRIIDTEGLQSARGRFKNAIESGKTLTSEDMAIGARLVQEYQKVGDNKATMDILSDMANGLSEVGRTLQSARILKRLSPEGRLMTVQKMANKIGDKTGTKIELSDEIIEKVKNAKTEKEISEVNHEVSTHVWEQVPPTLQDKLNAWRYMAMLTNPRTHFRNIVGNAIFVPAREIKNIIGAGLEKAFIKEGQRTKSIMPDAELVDFAKSDWPNAKPLFDKSSKYDEGLRDIKAKVFKTKVLEWLRQANITALEKEDEWFKYLAYKSSLSQYMKANNLKPSDMVGETLDKARRYAINEAKKATFTDDSAIASFLTKAKKSARESDDWVKKAGGIALESALPFTKTPINILKRGFEYSPIGLAKTITKGANDLKKGKINANEFIDDISKGFTGTALTGLGAILGYNGMVTSTQEGTRKEQDYSKMLGTQNYSIDTGDGTYTIDWAAPLSLPFFIGAEVAKSAMQDGLSLGETLDGLQSIANPILELSMLQGLTSSIEEFGVPSKTQGEKLIGAINNTIVGYISQFMPTLGGQLARISTPERKVTTSTADTQTVKMWQSAIKKLQSKVPGAQSNLEPYVDVWGRTETVDNAIDRFVANMVSPGYYKEKNVDAVDKEISRLAKSIGSDAIPRGVTNYTVQSDNKQYRMTDKELTQFKKDKGKASYNGVQKLIMTSEYRMASDEKKADMLDKVYRNSQNVAKENFFRNRGMTYEY